MDQKKWEKPWFPAKNLGQKHGKTMVSGKFHGKKTWCSAEENFPNETNQTLKRGQVALALLWLSKL
jgi:hypothetical protein